MIMALPTIVDTSLILARIYIRNHHLIEAQPLDRYPLVVVMVQPTLASLTTIKA